TKSDSLLGVPCITRNNTIGFATYVGRIEGLDPVLNMLAPARDASHEAGVSLTLHQSRLEDFSSPTQFDVITIGRALHWLDRLPAICALDRLLAPAGRILICGASTDRELTPWANAFR